jgi:hypothetical protein
MFDKDIALQLDRLSDTSVAMTQLDSTRLNSRRLGAVVDSARLTKSKSMTLTRLWS